MAGRGPGRQGKQRAMLQLTLGFRAFRTLTPEAGLNPAAAIEAIARAIETA